MTNGYRHLLKLRSNGPRSASFLAILLCAFGCSNNLGDTSAAEKEPELTFETAGNALKVNKPSQSLASTRSNAPTGQRAVWVVMKQRANLTSSLGQARSWKARGDAVYGALSGVAKTSQAPLLQFLRAKGLNPKPFWVVNAVKVTADEATITELAQRSDVAGIVDEKIYQVPTPQPGIAQAVIDTIEWNIQNVRAPEAWNTFGTRGEGVVIANIDTGVQFDHPALVSQYRGTQGDGSLDHNYNWYDPTGLCGSAPCDNAGHGTHTMGTIVGSDGGSNEIGVAPGAKWIAAKGCEDFGCSTESLLSAGQWMLAPTDASGANPRPDLRPNVVSNSWGGGSGDDFYRGVVSAWIAAGIFPVFSSGNSGPFCSSVGSPGDYPESYAVGAYDINNIIADFSSRGGSLYGEIKPNISAPGVDVRSSVPGNGYDWYNGTSMAAPHVAGAIALLWSAAPTLVGDIPLTRGLLGAGALDHDDPSCGGTPSDNNVWGEGQMDVVASLQMAPIGPTGWLDGVVASDAGGTIGGARIHVMGALDRTIAAGVDGSFNVRLPVGTYDVEASGFAYLPETVTGALVSDGATTTLNFSLAQAPQFMVSGIVESGQGTPLAGATVSIPGTPLAPVLTDVSGMFVFPSVPVGNYQFAVSAGGCFPNTTLDVVVDGDETLTVALQPKTDAYGYVCGDAPFSYVAATDLLAITGDDDQTNVPLPFSFSMYGQTYDTVTITTNGYLAFDSDFPSYSDVPIPDLGKPNAAVYGMWDDLYVDFDSGIYTSALGVAPNRQFVVEWRNVAFLSNIAERVNFEIILNETGEILVQHLAPVTGPLSQGSDATLGIEDPAGQVGIQYSYHAATIQSDTAVLYSIPNSGFVEGTVLDANDGAPISGASIVATADDGTTRNTRTNTSGQYRLQTTAGHYNVEASKTNYVKATQPADVVEHATTTVNFALGTAKAVVNPATIQLVLPANTNRTRVLTLENQGSVPMQYTVSESGGRLQTVALTRTRQRTASADPNARTTENVFLPNSPSVTANATPAQAGDIITSFPAGVGFGWGIGQAQNLWLSDLNNNKNVELTTAGSLTGVSFDAPWSGGFAADMALEDASGAMCQLAVGGDNAIHCWDQSTGAVVATITGPWASISQRGLAYKASDDTFFVGGWNEGIIYHVAGQSHSSPGSVLSSCSPSDYTISGLAYNGAMDVLWMATNSDTDTIYELNPQDCTVLSTLAPPQGGGYQGAGLEMDPSGNLWVVAQSPNVVYLVDSGVPAFSDVPWLSVVPAAGDVAPGAYAELKVTVNTSGLVPGLYLATLFVQSNSAGEPSVRIPVSIVVSGYLQAVNSGGTAYTDTNGDTWAIDRAYSQNSWGFVQRGKANWTPRDISGTTDPALYQTQREGLYGYRFDSVPNGIYQIDFSFAELERVRVGERLFDAIVEETVVLPAHDIQYEVGRFAAELRTFFVPVTDGRLDVRLLPRSGSKPAVINALRVTHRPDR
jgi:subtilisin family serine protease